MNLSELNRLKSVPVCLSSVVKMKNVNLRKQTSGQCCTFLPFIQEGKNSPGPFESLSWKSLMNLNEFNRQKSVPVCLSSVVKMQNVNLRKQTSGQCCTFLPFIQEGKNSPGPFEFLSWESLMNLSEFNRQKSVPVCLSSVEKVQMCSNIMYIF